MASTEAAGTTVLREVQKPLLDEKEKFPSEPKLDAALRRLLATDRNVQQFGMYYWRDEAVLTSSGALWCYMMLPLTHSEWRVMRKEVNDFYKNTTPDEILEMIELRLGRRRSSVRRSPRPRNGYVYLLSSRTGEYKIGQTKNIGQRIYSINKQLPSGALLIHSIPCKDRIATEKLLHEKFSHRRINGEWFMLSDADVDSIKSIREA
mgnify:CR=1 FL=1